MKKIIIAVLIGMLVSGLTPLWAQTDVPAQEPALEEEVVVEEPGTGYGEAEWLEEDMGEYGEEEYGEELEPWYFEEDMLETTEEGLEEGVAEEVAAEKVPVE